MDTSCGELFWRDHEFTCFYLSKHKIKINFLDFFCPKANLIWKIQIQIFFLNLHVKAKIQINWLDFSFQNTDANEFIWFYLSKHKIKINFLDFMAESKFDLKKTWKVTCKCWPDLFLLSKQKSKKKYLNLLVSLIKTHNKSFLCFDR